MTNLEKLEILKIDIRSILVSRNGQDITLPFLNKLYKEITDEDIPYTDFQYTSLKLFLNSMPEVLYLKNNKNNELCVYHIETKKSGHVSRLVSLEKQKPQNKKKPHANNAIDPCTLKEILLELFMTNLQDGKNKRIRKDDVLSSIEKKIGQYSFYTVKNLNNQLCELNHILYFDEIYVYFKPGVLENMVQVKTSYQEDEDLNVTNSNAIGDFIKESTKQRLKKLTAKYPNGIKCCDLPETYRYEYKLDLEYSDLGFSNILEFVGSLPDILKIVICPNMNQYMVVGTDITVGSYKNFQISSKTKLVENLDEIQPLPTELSDQVTRSLVSDKFVYNETIDNINISALLAKENVNAIDIIVSEVHNPSFFWVQLEKNSRVINELINSLQKFYENQNLDNYRIPTILIKPGLNVACQFSNQWHRGIVKTINSQGSKIHFYDYGTNDFYKLEDLYFLDRQFSVIPAQAIPCTLNNVKPIGSKKWSINVCKIFVERVFEKSFTASITNNKYESNHHTINLVDMNSNSEIVNISNWMVENGIAECGAPIIPVIKNQKVEDNRKLNTVNGINAEYLLTPIKHINYDKKLEILRRYKTKVLNNSRASSSNNSVTSENIIGV